MRSAVRAIVMLALLLVVAGASVRADDDKGEMRDDPMYRFWAKVKPGTTATVLETTKLHGAEKDSLPGGVDMKRITYRLASANDKQVVVVTTVVEEEFLGTVESAPTRHTYPAKVAKSRLEAV